MKYIVFMILLAACATKSDLIKHKCTEHVIRKDTNKTQLRVSSCFIPGEEMTIRRRFTMHYPPDFKAHKLDDKDITDDMEIQGVAYSLTDYHIASGDITFNNQKNYEVFVTKMIQNMREQHLENIRLGKAPKKATESSDNR